jgi:gas vesicle protein
MARKKSHRSGGKKKSSRRYKSCRGAGALRENWFQVPTHMPGESWKDAYATVGVTKCRDFKTEPIPCRYLPPAKVRAYANLCKIPNRTGRSSKSLCAALHRKNHTRSISPSCVNKRILDLIVMRDMNELPVDDIKIKAFRNVLRSAGEAVPRTNKDALKSLIMQKEAHIRTVQKLGKMKLKDMKHQIDAHVSELKEERKQLTNSRVNFTENNNRIIEPRETLANPISPSGRFMFAPVMGHARVASSPY